MAKKAETKKEVSREQFVRSLGKRLQDKTDMEKADAIVWAIEQMLTGDPQADPEPDLPAGALQQQALNQEAIENSIRKILEERDALKG